MAAAMGFRAARVSALHIDLDHMSEDELADFEKVMNRIEAANELETIRIRRLKSTVTLPESPLSKLKNFRLKTLGKLQCRSCGSICLSPKVGLGIPISKAFPFCRICQLPLCQSCTETETEKSLELCTGCRNKIIFDAKTGNWFHQQLKKRLTVDPQSPDSARCFQGSPKVQEIVPSSPKKKLLYRLRSYSSVHEELDEMDSPANVKWIGINDQTDPNQKRMTSTPPFYINQEFESEDEVKLYFNNDLANSDRNYYRPLSHISNQPLKSSSSNGSPMIAERHVSEFGIISNEFDPANSVQSHGAEVLIELDFNFRMSQFIIFLRQCRNLPHIDGIRNTICPYLFILLLPDRSRKSRRTTTVKKNCSSPTYDQVFKYSINYTELESRSVLVMLCHKDDLSSGDLALGQVIIPLSFTDFSQPIVRWYQFQQLVDPNLNESCVQRSVSSSQPKPSNIPSYLGEISLAIKFVPRTLLNLSNNGQGNVAHGELHVWVKSMKNIAQHQLSGGGSTGSPRRLSAFEEKSAADGRIMDSISFDSNKVFNTVAQLGQNQPVATACLLPYRTSIQFTSPAKSQADHNSQFVWSTILKFANVEIEELRTRSLEITIWINSKHGWLNRIIHPRCVGGIRLCSGGRECNSSFYQANQWRGASTGIIEEKMWTAMLDRNNTWIDGTVKLKMDPSFLNMNLPET